MKFIFKTETVGFGSPVTTLEVEVDQLEDVLHYFGDFLRGAGYSFDGHVDIVPYDEYHDCQEEYKEQSTTGSWPFPNQVKQAVEPVDCDLPFANYGGERCPNCGLTRQHMGQSECFDVRCGLGLNRKT